MHLPDALPDELLFSRLIRYCQLYAIPISQLLSAIYGDKRASINPILPAGLNSLSSLCSEEKDTLLSQQTLAPLFMHYYPNYKAKMESALSSNDNYKGIRLSQLSCVTEHATLTLKMCPACVREDIYHFGVSYWHLAHQIPAIESCNKHRQQLLHVKLPERRALAIGLPDNFKQEFVKSRIESHSLAIFASRVLWKQSQKATLFNLSDYRDKLDSLGYITKCGRIRRVKLLSEFYFFTSQLDYPSLRFLPSSETDYRYVTKLLYGYNYQHIFKYILFGYWLSKQRVAKKSSIKKLKQGASRTYSSSSTCLLLLKQGISVSAISKQIGRSRTYVKSIAYANGFEGILHPTKLNKALRDNIISLAWKGFNRLEIAKNLSVSSGSVEMIISSVKGLVEWRKKCKFDSMRRRYQCQILRYRQQYPERIRKDFARDCNTAFYWLYLHEHDWLQSILPPPKPRHLNFPN